MSDFSPAFLGMFESLRMGATFARGRRDERAGHVRSLTVSGSLVVALVRGPDDPAAFRSRIAARAFGASEWARVETTLVAEARYVADLLDGRMPPGIEAMFAAAGLSLLPLSLDEVAMDCTCERWPMPCAHLAATCYALARAFESDPFEVFTWRGRPRDELLMRLRRLREASVADASRESPPGWPADSGALSGSHSTAYADPSGGSASSRSGSPDTDGRSGGPAASGSGFGEPAASGAGSGGVAGSGAGSGGVAGPGAGSGGVAGPGAGSGVLAGPGGGSGGLAGSGDSTASGGGVAGSGGLSGDSLRSGRESGEPDDPGGPTGGSAGPGGAFGDSVGSGGPIGGSGRGDHRGGHDGGSPTGAGGSSSALDPAAFWGAVVSSEGPAAGASVAGESETARRRGAPSDQEWVDAGSRHSDATTDGRGRMLRPDALLDQLDAPGLTHAGRPVTEVLRVAYQALADDFGGE
ncbi:hypothetical protein [Actinoplanes sp. CA-252034]|uniref:SWIM zinc finger family protein n=1 Tax=Actinoplanes sp. CA-252034 TaxID=3239906 RepID=UPI003D974AF6